MNLKELFEVQRKLDERIEQEHPRQDGEDRLGKKILALQVELGECANEWRGFKFWSKNQKANYIQTCESCRGSGDWMSGDGECSYCEGKGYYTKPLLEEYVDCLHFILSIGSEHEFDDLVKGLAIEPIELEDITEQFVMLMRTDWEIYEYGGGGHYHEGLELFIGLGKMLGFTWEQIEAAYMEKNAVNHARQDSGSY